MSEFRIDQITNQAGTAGPQIAGITTFSGTSGLVMPNGNTFRTNIPENIVENGLVMYFDAGNKLSYSGSGTLWRDLRNNNNLTLTNGPTYSSLGGGSIVFDGVDDYAPVTFLTSPIIPKTILFFIKMASDNVGDTVLYGTDANGSDNWLGINGNKVSVLSTQYTDFNNIRLNGVIDLSSNFWYQVGCTLERNTLKVYVNGIEDSSITMSFPFAPWKSPVVDIGKRGGILQRYFPGNISNIQAYDRVLSASEIKQNFDALKGRYGL